jgi:hypothetical protein
MEILQFSKKQIHMDITEKLYTCKETTRVNQINFKHTVTPHEMFEAVLKGVGHLTRVCSFQ